jgi:hypothetical protein
MHYSSLTQAAHAAEDFSMLVFRGKGGKRYKETICSTQRHGRGTSQRVKWKKLRMNFTNLPPTYSFGTL